MDLREARSCYFEQVDVSRSASMGTGDAGDHNCNLNGLLQQRAATLAAAHDPELQPHVLPRMRFAVLQPSHVL